MIFVVGVMISRRALANVLTELETLHTMVVRRKGHPGEHKRQAQLLLQENLGHLNAAQMSGSEVARFASNASGLFHRIRLERAVCDRLTAFALESLEVEECRSRKTASRIGDLGLMLHQQEHATSSETSAVLSAVLGCSSPHILGPAAFDREYANDAERYLRVASAVSAPNFPFSFFHAGSVTLLERKRKQEMEMKMAKCSSVRTVLDNLTRSPLTKIDSQRLLSTLATEGFYSEHLVNQCCDIVLKNVAVIQPRETSNAIHSLGTLGHRHPVERAICHNLQPKALNAIGFRNFLVGLAMLQQPLKAVGVEAFVDDSLWLHFKREPTIDWWVDTLHALTCVDHQVPKFTLAGCRKLMTQIHKMNDMQRLKFLFSLKAAADWRDIPSDLSANWRKVDHTREILISKVRESALPLALQSVGLATVRRAGG